MKNDDRDEFTETFASPAGANDWDAESGGEAWCDDELAMDDPGGDRTEDETLIPEESPEITPAADSDLWLYRDRTSGILRRDLRLAVEVGRLPALLGREFFRTRVTSYHTQ